MTGDVVNENVSNDDDEERYILTEQALMQSALSDFNISVSIPMAKAIYETFMDSMCKAGYVEKMRRQRK